MDRQTRKTNLKKLQQETGSTKLRSTRSNKATKATMTLSEYFATPPDKVEEAACEERENALPSLDTDPFAEPITKKAREAPAVKQPKKTPKLKASAPARRGRAGLRGHSKKQPPISDFLRNEQLFAEVTAQHCIADNFNPDDIEMALMLSKSEAERLGKLRLFETDDSKDVVDLLNNTEQSSENIRQKLQKYGFRTAAKEEYNVLTLATLPAAKRGKRCKWANKFTPLTLRNPDIQQKKIDSKVAAIMAQQVTTMLPSKGDVIPQHELYSSRLQRLASSADSRITHEPSEGAISNLSAYYVEKLFEICYSPANQLLKNWASIQGRDSSPERHNRQSLRYEKQLAKVYVELEAYFGKVSERAELDELENLVINNMIEEDSKLLCNEVEVVSSGSISSQPPDKRARMVDSESNFKEDFDQPSTSSKVTLPTQTMRSISPDLFADSDDEQENEPPTLVSDAIDMKNISLQVYKDITNNSINTYEVYSSDEVLVKTVVEPSAEQADSFIDLTEEQKKIETILGPPSHSTIWPQDIFPPSPIHENYLDLESTSSRTEDCVISDELYAKYTEDKVDDDLFNLTLNSQTLRKNSFNLSITSSEHSMGFSTLHMLSVAAPNSSKDNSFSFTQQDITKAEFQRTRSFTQSPKQKLKLDNSFKSPLSRKSSSFLDKSGTAFVSPFSHSDASIDLTEDSDADDGENDGVLLSDDEINYSIWKANNTFKDKIKPWVDSSDTESDHSSQITHVRSVPYFKTSEDLEEFLAASPTASNKSCNSRSPNKSALSKERAEFGILDAALSQHFSPTQTHSPDRAEVSQVQIDWSDASFLDTPTEAPLKRYSSHKFNELLNGISTTKNDKPICFDDGTDEFDLLVFKSTKDVTISTATNTLPSGLERLLVGEINMDTLPESSAPSVSPFKSIASSEELEVDGKVYEVRICETPKPNFINLNESELMKQLYNYGIKPLKRKQAVKILEFIYNQTHPIVLPADEPQAKQLPLVRSKSTPVNRKPHAQLLRMSSDDCLTPTDSEKQTSFKFSDPSGDELLRFSQTVPLALCDDFEYYVLQTNVTKKTAQPLLPLHVAWHNLLSANASLHESILMFEPIDLQEIYLYFKKMGHRYDPKDLKCFFDRRCIIFRYELAPSSKQIQRHVRKKPKRQK